MTVVLRTNYADSLAHNKIDPVWGGYQLKDGTITLHSEAGVVYQRHQLNAGTDPSGLQRADVMTTALPGGDGAEVAFRARHMLEPGFKAENKGWNVFAWDFHDARGTVNGVGTQANMEMLTSENGVYFRVYGGAIGANGAPSSAADRWNSPMVPYPAGVWHDVAVYYRCSADRTKGHITVVFDGQTVVDKTCATIYDGSHVYLKQAAYRDGTRSGNLDNAARFQDLVAATGPDALQEVLGIQPPPPVDRFAASKAYVEKFRKGSPNIAGAFDELYKALG